jgi:L-alanine-DL-glutamate epimerase-like enolase superfamily enzyme
VSLAVAGLSAVRVRVPFRRPFATATGMWLHREAWLIRLVDRDGRIGMGEAVLEPAAGEVAETILASLVREAAATAATGRLPGSNELGAHGGPGRALRAAIDAALLDLGAPGPARGATAVLAPRAPGVPVNGTIAFAGPNAGAEAALQAVAAGFTTLKLKAGAERETEALVARVRAIRTAVGPDVRLRLDVNGAWDLATAAERLGAVSRFGIEYAEQPLAADDVEGMAELRRLVAVPIAADEAVESIGAVRALLAAAAVDVLVVKPARVGGPVAVAEIAARAAERGVPVVVSTLFETGVGIAAALAAAGALPRVGAGRFPDPLAHGLATSGLLEHDLLVDPLLVVQGRMTAPGGPLTGGLGVAVDDRAVARFTTEAVEATR